MKKRTINLVILTTLLVGGQVVDILPASTTVVAQAATNKTGTVTASVLNVRKSASTSSKILGKLKNGATVTIVDTSTKGWYKIKYGSGYGYVSSQYVSINSNSGKTTGDKVVTEAKKYIGTPYVWGGTTTSGFDCSGYTQYVFKKCGITIGRTTKDQIKNGSSVSKANLKKGDLVFFKDTYSGCTNPSHVGIYIGNNQFIHASSSKGVTISSLNSTYYTEHYYGARRVIK